MTMPKKKTSWVYARWSHIVPISALITFHKSARRLRLTEASLDALIGDMAQLSRQFAADWADPRVAETTTRTTDSVATTPGAPKKTTPKETATKNTTPATTTPRINQKTTAKKTAAKKTATKKTTPLTATPRTNQKTTPGKPKKIAPVAHTPNATKTTAPVTTPAPAKTTSPPVKATTVAVTTPAPDKTVQKRRSWADIAASR